MSNRSQGSLVPFGMAVGDDEDLRCYFELEHARSAPLPQERMRVEKVHLIASELRPEDRDALRSFYAPRHAELKTLTLLTAAGLRSEASFEEYARLALRQEPPAGDRDALLTWVASNVDPGAYLSWLIDLDERVALGQGSTRERQILARIQDAGKIRLSDTIAGFVAAKDHLEQRRPGEGER